MEEKSRTKLSRAVLVQRSLPYLRSSIWQDASRRGKEVVSTYESASHYFTREPWEHHHAGGCRFKFCSTRARARKAHRRIRCTFRVSEYLRGIYDSVVRGIFTPWWISARPYLARLTRCCAIVRRMVFADRSNSKAQRPFFTDTHHECILVRACTWHDTWQSVGIISGNIA